MPTYEEWRDENWNRAHKEKDISALTGTGYLAHLNTLGISAKKVTKDIRLLCIGVGTGEWVHEAAATVDYVWALDVAHNAKKSIPSSVHFTTDPELLPIGDFDLALSLWVAPHMTNRNLQHQLKYVIGSLKPSGIFAIHYKEPLHENAPLDNREGHPDEWEVAFGARMLRRRKHFSDMVEDAGGTVSLWVNERISHFHKIVEVCAHIQRRGT